MARRRRARGEGTIYQREDGLWTGQVSLGFDDVTGKRVRETFYGNTQAEVREKIEKRQQEVKEGILIKVEMPVNSCLDYWLSQIKHSVSKKTYNCYVKDLKPVRPYLDKLQLERLGAHQVSEALWKMEEAGASANTRRHALSRLRQALKYAHDFGMIRHNPAAKVPLPKHQPEEMKPLTPEEVGRLLDAARGDRFEALYITALDTGARQGELWALEWTDWHPNRRELVFIKNLSEVDGALEVKETKTRSSRRRVAVSPETAAALQAHRARMEKEGHKGKTIFCDTEGGYLRKSNFQRNNFAPLLKRAGLDCRFHDLRHTCATLLLSDGHNVKVVSERLGHANAYITLKIYSHVLPGFQAQAAESMSRFLKPRGSKMAVDESCSDEE